MRAHRRGGGLVLLFLQPWQYMGRMVNVSPQPLTLEKETGYPLSRRLVSTRAGLARGGKFRPLPEFDPRTATARSASLNRLSYAGTHIPAVPTKLPELSGSM
jgi:hypothetical protein